MYNFEFLPNEELIEIFDNTWIKQGAKEKTTTIALTNQRLLFLDYLKVDEGAEVLRIANGVDYIRVKDVYYQIKLTNIESIIKQDTYIVTLTDQTNFEFDNENLYNLLIK